MSREVWRLIKQDKLFYINSYRRAASVLLVLFSINLALSVGIVRVYFNQPDRRYYSTNGVGVPEELVPMEAPNNTPNALLADDPVDDDVVLTMPE